MPINFDMKPPASLKVDSVLRGKLLDYFVETATGPELSGWLEGLGQETKGTVEDKRTRVRQNTAYLTMPCEGFPQQTLHYLEPYPSDLLADLCEELDLDSSGTKEIRTRRIMRELGICEGWIPRYIPTQDQAISIAWVKPLVEWHLIAKRGNYEKDFYPSFFQDMEEMLTPEYVHAQFPIATGSTLRVDFHIGHPSKTGIGIEFKQPGNNSDLQKALGQMDQYKTVYGDRLIVVLFPDFLDQKQVMLFSDQLSSKGICSIIK